MKTILRAPRYEPMTWDGETYVVQVNPSLGLLIELTEITSLRRLAEILAQLVKEHPYVDESGAPLPLTEVEPSELKRFMDAYTEHLTNLPKA